MTSTAYDAIVIGAGPAGSLTALCLARKGRRVLVLDKGAHPRHRIGESLLPKTLQILQELGLEEEMRKLPHMVKPGGEFLFGHEDSGFVAHFETAWPVGTRVAFNLERAPFDAMLCRVAREAGAEVREGEGVETIVRLADRDVELVSSKGETLRAKWLVDCSGQATVVGRHLGTRKLTHGLDRVAYFAIGTGVERPAPPDEGLVIGVIHSDGWFWSIPLDAERTSVGVVLDRRSASAAGVKPHELLAWAIARSPQMARRCRDAVFPARNEVIANFTYTCAPYAGPGYFLVGDAATFLDPIFSTGVTLGMDSAREVANLIDDLERGSATPARAREQYIARIEDVTGIFFGLVNAFYDHPFRELFLNYRNPLGVRRAIVTLLAGHAFEAPRFLRWRLWLLHKLIAIQRRVPIVPRRTSQPLLGAEPRQFGAQGDAAGEAAS